MITFKRGEVIKLPLKRTFDRVFLTPEIAKQIIPREVLPGTNLSSLTGCLQVKDNLHDIKVCLRLYYSYQEQPKMCNLLIKHFEL